MEETDPLLRLLEEFLNGNARGVKKTGPGSACQSLCLCKMFTEISLPAHLRAQLVGFEPYKHNSKKIIDNARWINANVNEYMK